MKSKLTSAVATCLVLAVIAQAEAGQVAVQPAPSSPTVDRIAQRTAGMYSQDGFFPLHYDEDTGRLKLEVTRLGEDFLYTNTLATGLGSNQVGLDRGQTGVEAVVRFERRGQRILLIRQNTSHRATTDNPELVRSVEESFPSSVIASFTIDTEEGDRYLVDATDFFLSDAYDVRGRVRATNQGDVRVDADRSYIRRDMTQAFPINTEVRAALTYTTDSPGPELRAHAPDGRYVTLEQHHSFVQLPEPGFRPRVFDPRSGNFALTFYDFAQGFEGDYRERYVVRWRLEKQDPSAEISEPVKPIVYYLDPAVPEPYRTAFREGGMWWNEIFEAAGFRNAFRIEDLPDDVDPMDARYSVIQWVHRTSPGPSVGPSYRDPRTGEIIKTVIRMDSYRSLVDYNIYAGLRPALRLGGGPHIDAEEFAMARRRQHTAHEIGHTLGFPHNFAAASQGRSSVMDYPFPLIELDDDGYLDISRAYRDGGGFNDTLSVRYAYTPFDSPEAEAEGLRAIVEEAIAAGNRFITGGHASAAGSIPEATQWIEGSNMVEALERAMAVRELLIEHFGEEAIRPGEPMARLNERFAHVYLHHRYALEAATKYVGGMEFAYALRGDGQAPTRVIPAADQRRALELVLSALSPRALAVPERVVAMIPPTPFGYAASDRWIDSPAGPAFDPLAVAGSLAGEIAGNLLHRERAARLVSFHAREASNPSLEEVIGRLIELTWTPPLASELGAGAAYRHVARRAVLDGLLDLAADSQATTEVRAIAEDQLLALSALIDEAEGNQRSVDPHAALARRDIERFIERQEMPTQRSRRITIPLPWP